MQEIHSTKIQVSQTVFKVTEDFNILHCIGLKSPVSAYVSYR